MFISVCATIRQIQLWLLCVFGCTGKRKNAVARVQLMFFLMQKLNYCDNYLDFPPTPHFFFSPEQNRLGCFVVSFPGRHTPPISNMGGTEELILLHSVSKATLPTQKHRQYAQLQILRHWCKDSLTNQSTRIYYYLLAISQATELYRLAIFFLF